MKLWNKIKDKFPFKASRVASILVDSWSGGIQWSNKNYENFAKETYLKNVIAFRCIMAIAQSVSSVPWGLYKKVDGKREQIEDHIINKMLKRPNDNDSWSFLMLKATAFLALAGNSYFERVTPMSGENAEIPREMYILRPDRMQIMVNKVTGDISGYKYTKGTNSEMFEVNPITGHSNILHVKFFHPTDDWYGAAITESAAREVDSSNEATEWNMRLLQNNARPGMIFSFEGNMSQQQFDRLEKQLKENYSGSKNAGRNLILEGVGQSKQSVAPYGYSPQEMDWIESNRELARRICYAWGVPPQLVGIPGDNTYSNYQEARLALWEDTVIYYLEFFKGEFNNWLFSSKEDKPESDLFLDYSLDNISALAIKRDLIWKKANEATFLTENEKREMVGYEAVEGGDVVLIPANMIPLGFEGEREEVEEESNITIEQLVEEGYSQEEAENMVGVGDYKSNE